jgi:hypothetical protein
MKANWLAFTILLLSGATTFQLRAQEAKDIIMDKSPDGNSPRATNSMVTLRKLKIRPND